MGWRRQAASMLVASFSVGSAAAQAPQNPTPVDHSTDTYDTIDWLVKNVPETRSASRA